MDQVLRVLVVDDSEPDALLLVRALRRADYQIEYERVETAEAMAAAIDRGTWDLILSDYSMPRFSALMALALVKERQLDLPFVIVSGTVSEDIAVEAIHAGAHDFMAKGRLTRLVPAIQRELRAARLRAEQKRMQDQLMISDRMASMGMLASGVAHEINNPLSCVLANLDLAAGVLAEKCDPATMMSQLKEVREELRDARSAANRIRDIVRDLKIFSRAEDERTGPVDVERVLESTLRMAWNEVRHRARLVKHYGKIPPVEASESRLGQVFLNVVVNAAQAIEEGRAAKNEIRVTTFVGDDGQVVIEVSDTGAGMSPEVLANLFTPFFTTKPVGIGTGLGLSICHRIVTGFGGQIQARSEVGKGSTLRISLPRAHSTRPRDAAAPAQEPPQRRSGRILVVDDEPMIAKVVERALAPEHEVVAAGSAGEALHRIGAGERFDVILCDLMMPEMTGMELHLELSRLPGGEQASRMIFLTGGAFTNRARLFLDETPNLRIEKPFDTLLLRALVNDRIR
jgi:signal transduction histidine kinase